MAARRCDRPVRSAGRFAQEPWVVSREWLAGLCEREVQGDGGRRAARTNQNRLSAIGARVDVGRCAAGQLGDQLAGGGGHRQAEHVVAGGDDHVFVRSGCGR